MTRSDTTWITLRAGLRDLLLQEHHRPYGFFHNFPHPAQQCPQMIMLVGDRMKTLVMGKMRWKSHTRESASGEVHLRVDRGSFGSQSPIIFADCELHTSSSISKLNTERPPGDVVRRPLTWHRGISQALDPTSLAQMVYSKLLAPFSNVICFFADDFGGLVGVAEILALWLMSFNNRSSDLPPVTRPRVLILTRSEDPSTFDEQKATRTFMLDLGREAERKHSILTGSTFGRLKKVELDALLGSHFGDMHVIAFSRSEPTPRLLKSLKARILQDSQDVQANRRDARVAFSVPHFKAFFHLANDHFCRDIVTPFSFVRASRIQDPVPEDFLSHVATFLKQVDSVQLLNFAVPIIASAFVLDSYPTGMHGFHPLQVFKQFFYRLCLQLDPFGDGKIQEAISSTHLVNAIEVSFCQYAFEIIDCSMDVTIVHTKVLSRFRDIWSGIYSNTTCLACLAGNPENTLLCRHAICVPCTIAHGQESDVEPWTFCIISCPLCGQADGSKFVQKPDTAGIRALIAEGGGIRGIISLSFLKELERAIDLPMGAAEHFDIAVGSSSGAISVLGLYANKWTVDKCLEQFQALSTVAFRKRALFGIPYTSLWLPGRITEIVLSFITDSRYSSSGITRALKTAFGDEKSLFASSAGGTKIAVVATTTGKSSTCVFTNYNGPKKRPENCGYKLVRPEDINRELLVWQTARASSAAPPYFKSFQGYHDGGLGGHNNPINLALWEQDTIWSRKKKQPDVVVSLGTGFRRNTDSESGDLEKVSPFRARYVPRLFRSFLNFFIGENRWQELQNSLEPQVRDRYHRMNIEFYGDEPDLDDLQVMPSLQQQATYQARSNNDINICADNLLATLFYVELRGPEPPVFDGTLFTCKARIRCRLGPSHKALRVLASRLKESGAHFYLDFEQKVPCIDEEFCRAIECGAPFYRDIVFKVMSLDECIDIKIDGITRRARSISNCPYKVETLIQDQGLDLVFGSRKGRKRSKSQSAQTAKRVKFLD